MKYLLAICLFLTGCAHQPTSVIIPARYSTAPLKTMAPLEISKLNPNSNPDDVMRAYVKSIIVQKNYIKYLITVLSAYQ